MQLEVDKGILTLGVRDGYRNSEACVRRKSKNTYIGVERWKEESIELLSEFGERRSLVRILIPTGQHHVISEGKSSSIETES